MLRLKPSRMRRYPLIGSDIHVKKLTSEIGTKLQTINEPILCLGGGAAPGPDLSNAAYPRQ